MTILEPRSHLVVDIDMAAESRRLGVGTEEDMYTVFAQGRASSSKCSSDFRHAPLSTQEHFAL